MCSKVNCAFLLFVVCVLVCENVHFSLSVFRTQVCGHISNCKGTPLHLRSHSKCVVSLLLKAVMWSARLLVAQFLPLLFDSAGVVVTSLECFTQVAGDGLDNRDLIFTIIWIPGSLFPGIKWTERGPGY